MTLRPILYDAIPPRLDSPPHRALEALALLARYSRNYAAALFILINWTLLVVEEADWDYYDDVQAALTRYDDETKGQETCVVGVLAVLCETEETHEGVFGSGGHATRDWSLWFRVQERGLEEH